MIRKGLVFFLLCFFLEISSNAQPSDSNSKSIPLFSINKKPVLTDEFIYLYRKNHPDKPGEFAKEKIEEYLDLFINFKLKVEEARHRGLDTTSAFRKEYGTY